MTPTTIWLGSSTLPSSSVGFFAQPADETAMAEASISSGDELLFLSSDGLGEACQSLFVPITFSHKSILGCGAIFATSITTVVAIVMAGAAALIVGGEVYETSGVHEAQLTCDYNQCQQNTKCQAECDNSYSSYPFLVVGVFVHFLFFSFVF